MNIEVNAYALTLFVLALIIIVIRALNQAPKHKPCNHPCNGEAMLSAMAAQANRMTAAATRVEAESQNWRPRNGDLPGTQAKPPTRKTDNAKRRR